ncbi:MAG TPA: aromatic amino acid ammonia-lyase, partial [Prolixibacteraceae bacterium]|nr:aromatic amino acid ammonia-lyase [Prolixibacteraceae bacterium]
MLNPFFHYGEDNLTVGIAMDIIQNKTKGILSDKTRAKIQKNRGVVATIVHNAKEVYGVNTGFGPLCTTLISEADTRKLQYNLLISHSVGVGKPTTPEIAKLMMVLKVHSLAQGFSGISIETLERIIWHIDNNIIPYVPEQGSVGASGDLAQLAHLFLPLIGQGSIWHKGQKTETKTLFEELSIKPVELGPKEGLALINGTQFMLAHAVMLVQKFQNCLDH